MADQLKASGRCHDTKEHDACRETDRNAKVKLAPKILLSTQNNHRVAINKSKSADHQGRNKPANHTTPQDTEMG